MRKIRKSDSPQWFEDWKKNFVLSTGRQPVYKDDFPAQERRRLRKQLLEEQGYICCYCMRRIKLEDSHVEHFWPKDEFEDRQMDYGNLFASCQGNSMEDDSCGHKKNDWYDVDMIMPTDGAVEKLFSYKLNGEIICNSESGLSEIAVKMRDNLGLDAYYLTRNRKNAIMNSEVCEDYEAEELWDIIEYYDSKIEGKYAEYNMAIIDCLKKML